MNHKTAMQRYRERQKVERKAQRKKMNKKELKTEWDRLMNTPDKLGVPTGKMV